MHKSDEINELADALSKFQGEVQNIAKDKKGYGYFYAELSSILDFVRPLLAKHGLAVIQLCESKDELVGVETVLTHKSGQFLSSTFYMQIPDSKGMSKPQSTGSVITYARRYSLAAMLGIAQADNDAHCEPVEPVDYLAVLKTHIVANSVPKDIWQNWLTAYGTDNFMKLTTEQLKEILTKEGQL